MKRLILLIVLSVFVKCAEAQVYLMGNANVSTCSGTFYDSGGQGGAYSNNENFVQTFCSSVPGQCVKLSFTQFDIENNFDFLTIYDGPNTASPIIGTFTGTTIANLVTATSGCLTIRFQSDGSFANPGWAATVGCSFCPATTCAASCNGGAPPSNDDCSTAMQLGALPTPTPCINNAGGLGAAVSVNTTNLCATAANPYVFLNNCGPSGTNTMPSPAADVWYAFNVTGTVLNISITGGLQQPVIGLYSGASCGSLVGRGCEVGANGSLSASYPGLTPGLYFLQVSGGSLNDQCDFTLNLYNNNDCEGCVVASTLTATPPPVNGTYGPNQSVTFCYTVTSFLQSSVNWLHGVVPEFGSGWVLTGISTTSPLSCAGTGTWNWYNSVTSSNTGTTYGPGFFFETPDGNPSGVADNNPGNNYGDNSANCPWTFCFTVKTPPAGTCVQGADLSVTVNTLGDAESGSWNLTGCEDDPETNFNASLLCCTPPTLIVVNPLCSTTLGSATAQGQNGGPWDYAWYNSANVSLLVNGNVNGSSGITNLAPGNYSVVVTDNSGCSTTTPFTITAPPALTVSAVPTPVACNAGTTGSILVTAGGGSPAYTYQWSAAASGSNPQNLPAGTYTVTVTDSKGCTASATTVVTQPAALTATTGTVVNVTCPGGSDGSASVSAGGGIPPYTYLWSNSANTSSVNSLAAGSYTVTVTDSRGCTKVNTITITDPSAFVLTMNATPASCGNANGTASVVVSGGTGPYTYTWTPAGGTAANATALSSGGYSVTVTDSRNCTASNSTVVNNGAGPVASVDSETPVSCNGLSDGSAAITVSGGALPYSIAWSPVGGTALSASGLPSGPYVVTVTDATGCTSTAAINITQPSLLTVNTVAVNDVTCNGSNDGSATVAGSGGTPGYSYVWSEGTLTATVSNLSALTYTVTVTDNSGCTALTTVTPNQPSVLSAVIATPVSPSCNGAADGNAVVAASGGTAPYSYLWSNGSVVAGTGNVSAATYTVTVTDDNGCSDVGTVSITDPALLTVAQGSVTSAGCNGAATGAADVIAAGGTAPYSYQWSPSGGTAANANGLTTGNYTVDVTDSKGCTATIVINIPATPSINVQVNPVSVTCNGAGDGSIAAAVSGGTAPYSYSWSGGQSTQGINNLSGGTYTVTVTDQSNCSQTVSDIVDEPTLLTVVASETQPVSCNGASDGIVKASVSGGTIPYTYQWSSGGSAQTESLLSQGTYTVTVTDANGCSATATVPVTQPAAITLAMSSTVASCGTANGTATATASNGTLPYSYLWSSGDLTSTATGLSSLSYTVTVTDASGCTATDNVSVGSANGPTATTDIITDATCNGAADGTASFVINGGALPYNITWHPNVSSGLNATGLTAANYDVTVTDNNGCSSQVTLTVNEPAALVVNTSVVKNVSCNGGNDGEVSAVAMDGTPGYIYTWSSGSATGLSTGNYTVTVTDANGCTVSAVQAVTEPDALLIDQQIISNVSCAGGSDGSIDLTVTGGTTNYSYIWSGGNNQNPYTGLSAGNYTVTVTDANGCTVSDSYAITQPAAMTLAFNTTAAACGQSNGTATAMPSNGTQPYSYLWSSGDNTSTAAGLSAVTYTVTITDDNGCTVQDQVSVPNSNGPAATLGSVTSPLCNNGNDGAAVINVNGGALPYSFAWTPAVSTSAVASSISAGNYDVTVTDANGCTSQLSFAVSQPDVIIPAITVISNVTCNGGNDGSLSVAATGGTGTYSYLWSSGDVFDTISAQIAGPFTVTVTDINGCSADVTGAITEPLPLSLNLVSNISVTCNGGSDGELSVNTTGGVSPYSYLWNGGSTLNPNSSLTAGNYTVTVTDDNGCTETDTYSITQPLAMSFVFNATSAACGQQNGSASVIPSGGVIPYQYLWDNNNVTSQINNVAAGIYTVTVTDASGCTGDSSVVITNLGGPSVAADVITPASCYNSFDGSASVSTNGGAGVLTYVWTPNVSITNSASNLSAGNYDVTVSDANGCQSSITLIVPAPAPLLISFNTTPASCNQNNGSAEAVINGGQAPYNFTWSSGGVTAIEPSLAGGTYTVTVTDNNGCSVTADTTVNNSSGPVIAIQQQTDVTCFGADDGSAVITVNGGNLPYTYNWSTGATASSLNNLPGGTHTVTVTDADGCQATTQVLIDEPDAITLQLISTPATCGQANGSAEVTASGGAATFSYLWSDASTNALLSNQFNGVYTVTVTDGSGCTADTSVSIVNTSGPQITLSAVTDVSCAGGSDGAVTVNITGTLPPNGIQWSPAGGNTTSAINLTAGPYTVTATDVNGCSAVLLIAVNEPLPLTVNTLTTPVSCNGGNDGTVTVDALDGTAPYTYLWTPGGVNAASRNNLAAGNYSITVTDANGCTQTTVANVSQPDVISSFPVITHVSCAGGADGVIDVTPNGGLPPYQYLWDNGNTSSQLTGLTNGNYTLTISDNNGCDYTQSFALSQPAAIILADNIIPSVCGTASGSVNVNVSGGTGTLSYQWDGSTSSTSSASNLSSGTYTLTVTDQSGCSVSQQYSVPDQGGAIVAATALVNVTCFNGSDGSASVKATGNGPFTYNWIPSGGTLSSASGLAADNYSVEVTDVNGCVSALPLVITQPTEIQPSVTPLAATCGFSNGTAGISVTGGTGNYQYTWSSGVAVNDSITQLSAGPYSVTVADASGCTVNTAFIIPALNGPVITASQSNNVTCPGGNDGSAGVTVAGNVNYLWQPTGGNASSASNLTAGNYSVQVTDASGCTIVHQIIITEPDSIQSNSIVTPAFCSQNTGGLNLSPQGGTAPYTYLWSNGNQTSSQQALAAADYTVTVTDSRGCTISEILTIPNLPGPLLVPSNIIPVTCAGLSDGSASITVNGGTQPYTYAWSPNVSSSSSASNLSASNYSVVVTDMSGCSSVIQLNVPSPVVLSSATNILQNVNCFNGTDGSAIVQAQGGTPPYSYMWSSGNLADTLTNAAAGAYTVTITDANGCSSSANTTITQPTALNAVVNTPVDVTCFGTADGHAGVAVNGGVAPYSYNWSNGLSSATSVTLTAGTYTITVTDANSCTSIVQTQVSSPTAISYNNVTINNVSCNGLSDGTAVVYATGGTGSFTYLWSDGSPGNSNNNLSASSYTVTATDANGCTETLNINVTQPDSLLAQAAVTDVACNGDPTGIITVTPSGGTSPYTVNWPSTGLTGSQLSNVTAGPYPAVVTDAHNCTYNQVWSIAEPSANTASVNNPDTICIGSAATLTVTNGGGVPPYSYLWSNGTNASVNNVSPSATSIYSVTITDNNGCTLQLQNILVPVFPALTVNVVSDKDTICVGDPVNLSSAASGGNGGPYTYSWSVPGATNQQLLYPDSTAAYTVTVHDNCGTPSALDQLTVIVNPLPLVTMNADIFEGCAPLSVAFQTVNFPGSSYSWNFQNSGQSVSPSPHVVFNEAGTYDITLTVIDTNSCRNEMTIADMIEVFVIPQAIFTADPDQASLVMPEISFANHSMYAVESEWNFGDASPLSSGWSPTHAFQDTGHYNVQLIVTSDDGCRDTAYREIMIKGGSVLYIPNAFSPNGDDLNETFTAKGLGIDRVEFMIYNRWGKKIFSSSSLDVPWDGRDQDTGAVCPEGTYIYLFRVHSIDDKDEDFTGRVSLVR